MRFACLAVALFIGGGGAAAACPDYDIEAYSSYSGTGEQFLAPQFFSVIAGGENDIWNCSGIAPRGDQGSGYFAPAPDFRLQIEGLRGMRLVISAVSECDAALLVNTATADWYYDDDDNGDLDPRIILTEPVDGLIDVWVGTYDGEYCDAELRVETFYR